MIEWLKLIILLWNKFVHIGYWFWLWFKMYDLLMILMDNGLLGEILREYIWDLLLVVMYLIRYLFIIIMISLQWFFYCLL
jgi:hypothetical protein